MQKGIWLLLVLAAACTPRINTDPSTGRVDMDVEPVTQRGEVWNAQLKGQGSFATVGGTASATVQGDHSMVSVTLTGATPGAVHPWHVHEGTCGSGGGIVGSPSAYTPLSVGSSGRAETTAHLMLTLNEAKRYYVNVHASANDMGTIVACGDLTD